MSAINLFWQLDISDTAKFLLIVVAVGCVIWMCYMQKKTG